MTLIGRHFAPEIARILNITKETAPRTIDNTVWVTKAWADEDHGKHVTGEAFDIRIKNVIGFNTETFQYCKEVEAWVIRIRKQLGPGYDVVYGDSKHMNHIHCEYDPGGNMVQSSETDYAWAAGFMDADGSFSLNMSKGIQAVAQITQAKVDPLLKLQEMTGTKNLSIQRFRDKRYWKMSITGKHKLLPFLIGIYPHLVSKKEQCRLLIEVMNKQRPRGGGKPYSDTDLEWFTNTKLQIQKLNADRLAILNVGE